MIHLMIDTCSLLQLADKNGYSQLLQLDTHVNNHVVVLYVNESIIEEWNKHKNDLSKREQRVLLRKNQTDHPNQLLPAQLNKPNTVIVNDQLLLLDELINKAELIKTPEGIRNEAIERIENKLAPFHKGQSAVNDWKIIGSFGNYCEKYGVSEMCFISNNKNEFADPNNPKRNIHSDIQERFRSLKINYYKDYSDFFREIDCLLGKPLIQSSISSKKYSFKATKQKNEIDSVYYLFHDLYKELNFIPINILRKYYPFAHSEDFKANYYSFELSNVQKGLMRYLNNIEIVDSCKIQIKENSDIELSSEMVDKLRFILKRFNSNLIYNISGYEGRTSKDLKFSENQDSCDCCKCLYESFNFQDTYNQLIEPIKMQELSERMKVAYYKFKLGQTIPAYIDFKKISEDALKSNSHITYFISTYNQVQLGRLLYFDLDYTESECERLSNEAQKIDLFEIANNLKSLTDYELVLYIAKQSFFHNGYEQISTVTDKIIENKQLYENGGWSSNSHVSELVQYFGETEFFIRSNYVIFDEYSDFDRLFDSVTQGMLVSYSTSKKFGGRLTGLNSYWLHKILMYGTPKSIKKYFAQNQLNIIDYTSNETDKDIILEFSKNLLSKKNIEFVLSEFSNKRFEEKYNRYSQNLVTLSAYLNFDNNVLELFATLLIDFVELQKDENYDFLDAVHLFINKKGKTLSLITRNRFLFHYIKLDYPFKGSIVATIIRNYKENEIEITPTELDQLILDSITNNNESGFRHKQISVLELFKVVDSESKIKIVNAIQFKLNKQFDFELFYDATMREVISLNKRKLFKLIDNLDIDKYNPTLRPRLRWGRYEYQISYLNELLNICFKNNLKTNTFRFQKFKKINNYYEWLVEMDNFDYTNFDIEWIVAYDTVYFNRQMSKSKETISFILEYLKNKRDRNISDALIEIQNYSN